MKKYLYLLFLTFSFCSSIDTTETDYSKNLIGDYKLISMESNTALDLNFDGFAQKDLLEEIDCLFHNSFEFIDLQIRVNGSSRFFNYATANSYVYSDVVPYSQCFSIDYMSCLFDFNNDEKKIIITNVDSERELEYGKLLNVYYLEDEKEITVEIETKLFTSEGWKTIIITSVYKNIYDDNFAS